MSEGHEETMNCGHGITRLAYACADCLTDLRAALASARERAKKVERERDEARAENDVNHRWTYCPMCGSCGIGGCCGYFCDLCKDRHDKETQDGTPPHDLGDLRVMQGAWKMAVKAAEAERDAAREEMARLREAAIVVALAVEVIGQRYRDDWSDFDGRTLKAELLDAIEPLNAALADAATRKP